MKNLGREVVVLGCFLNPVMYYAVSRYLYEMYPNCREPIPAGINNLTERLGEIFHLEKIRGEKPFVRQVGWRVKESEEEHEAILAGNKDEIVFYLEQNPRYWKGYGLEIVIPITFTNLIVSFFNSLVIKAAPRLRCFKKTPLK